MREERIPHEKKSERGMSVSKTGVDPVGPRAVVIDRMESLRECGLDKLVSVTFRVHGDGVPYDVGCVVENGYVSIGEKVIWFPPNTRFDDELLARRAPSVARHAKGGIIGYATFGENRIGAPCIVSRGFIAKTLEVTIGGDGRILRFKGMLVNPKMLEPEPAPPKSSARPCVVCGGPSTYFCVDVVNTPSGPKWLCASHFPGKR